MIRKLKCRLAENIRMRHKEKKGWKTPERGVRDTWNMVKNSNNL